MRRIQDVSAFSFFWIFIIVAFLVGSALPGLAQRTVVQDAGAGRKLELHYNAAGQIIETDTLGPDGKVLQKQVLEYSPGAYVPQTTSTSYWPNGNVHKITRNTYDNNSNFTGEVVKVFDESGKQTAGHELRHDPQTNRYHCTDWDAAAQKFQPTKCPAGEESSGPPETLKKFTQEEVTQQLTAARQAARQPPKSMSAAPPSAQPEAGTNVKEVGLVFPSPVRIGERISGRVVEDPVNYEGTPGLMVTRIALPFPASGEASTLAGWRVLISGEPQQPADGPIALTVPPGQLELAVLFRTADGSGAPVSKLIRMPVAASSKSKPPTSYLAPAICLKGELCVVHGPFTGNSSKTFAAFEQRPTRIVAETSDTAYIAIPERTEAGLRPLVIAEGSKAIAFPVVVAEFTVAPTRPQVQKGELLLIYATIDGPQELPDPLWVPGAYPPANVEEARKLIPGFQPPRRGKAREKHEEEEKREASAKQAGAAPEQEEDLGGEILVVVKNLTPNDVTFRDSKNGTYIFHLKASSFSMGEFKYKFVVEALQTGAFAVQSAAIPLLEPLMGQEFPITSDASAK